MSTDLLQTVIFIIYEEEFPQGESLPVVHAARPRPLRTSVLFFFMVLNVASSYMLA